ncbi:MAG TPA: hypothetical protein PL033_15080 [Candidatus Brocadiia bacterium]|nr:hypothetical protein [Candidatus Brocadiia bacterium]
MSISALLLILPSLLAGEAEKGTAMEVVKMTNAQKMMRPHGAIIITSDEEMERLEKDPAMTVKAFGSSMEKQAEQFEGYDYALINVAYDFFFGGKVRNYFPTSPQCIRAFKALHDVARRRGVGFGASVLSPLDLGPAYYREKGRGGRSAQFEEGEIGQDGSYRVPLRIQKQWFHNKGPVMLYPKTIRAFAFNETRIGGTHYYCVPPETILDVSASASLTIDESSAKMSGAGYGYAGGVVSGKCDAKGRNRVMAVVIYDVEEMDYFHPDALPFLTGVLDAHKAAGISYDSFYSDEMHIQFDWDLSTHFGITEIDTRHITPGLVDEFCRRFGEQYRDFEKYLIYFSFAQHDFLPDMAEDVDGAKENKASEGSGPKIMAPIPPGTTRTAHESEPEMAQHVFGPTERDIYNTWKFRRDYHRMLTDHVVDLFIQAKKYGEKLYGREIIWTRAHATWQEAPTCDQARAPWAKKDDPVSRYDFTPAYHWSSSIRENISACYDYFRWGDFLTGMGNDHPEGGYIDRNYFGAALACSFGNFNEVPYSYWGHWGAPAEVSQRVHDVAAAMGIAGHSWQCGYVQDWRHRKSPVLSLYPLDLNYVEERYGSWNVQYGYSDYLTEEKFAEMAEVLPDGRFRVKDREYSALVVMFEPMIQTRTLELIRAILDKGGTVLWTGPAPAIFQENGQAALRAWMDVFGVDEIMSPHAGKDVSGCEIRFCGTLESVPAYRLLSHLLPDLIYPLKPAKDTQSVALCGADIVGTMKKTASGGKAVCLGARPRDDQSGSLSDAPRTLFHLLRALGVYTPDAVGWAEHASNTGDLMAAEFPNGSVGVTHHYYRVIEKWTGGFFRKEGEKYEDPLLPPVRLQLKGSQLGPYRVSYEGDRVLTFNFADGNLIAFSGVNTQGITLNGGEFRFADDPVNLTFAPIPDGQLAPDVKKAWAIVASRAVPNGKDLTVSLPFHVPHDAFIVPDPKGNGRGEAVRATLRLDGATTLLTLQPDKQGILAYIVAR